MGISRTGKRKRRESKGGAEDVHTINNAFPSDIIRDILLHLPPRSVLKFRCVCKLFNQLSTTQEFISEHTRQFHRNPHGPPTSLALFHETSLFIARGRTQGAIERIPLDDIPILQRSTNSFILEASCDGLLCFSRDELFSSSFFIVNPLTRQYLSVSHPTDFAGVLGFYYHEQSSSYRLLLMVCDEPCKQYHLYTFGSKKLTKVPNSTTYEGHCCRCAGRPLLIRSNIYCIGFLKGHDSEIGGKRELLEINGKLGICKIHHAAEKRPKLQVELWILNDQGNWKKKKAVCRSIRSGQEENYNVVANVSCDNYHHFLLVKSEGMSLEKTPFNFYCLEENKDVIKTNYFSCSSFRETLASVGKQRRRYI